MAEALVDRVDKVELHCHLDAVVDPAMLRELHALGHALPIDPAKLDAVYPIETREDWVGRYAPLVAPCNESDALRAAMLAAYVRRARRDGVVYLELMVSGLLFARPEIAGVVELVRALREAADRAASGAIQVEFLIAVGRRASGRMERQAERILALGEAGLICGVALAGDELACSVRALRSTLDRFRDAGLALEIHAGEQGGPDSVRDALENGRPRRIGHCVSAFRDPALLDELQARDVHLEFCPTSNVKTGCIAAIEEHPIAIARERGMNFSVSTDDPGPFACSMASEHELLERVFGFDGADFERMRANALRSSFAPAREDRASRGGTRRAW